MSHNVILLTSYMLTYTNTQPTTPRPQNWYPWSDSNRHCRGFKPPDSAVGLHGHEGKFAMCYGTAGMGVPYSSPPRPAPTGRFNGLSHGQPPEDHNTPNWCLRQDSNLQSPPATWVIFMGATHCVYRSTTHANLGLDGRIRTDVLLIPNQAD